MIGLRIVHLGGACQVQLGVRNEFVVLVDQVQIELGVFLDAGIGDMLGDVKFAAVGGAGKSFLEWGQVVLIIQDLEVGQELAAFVDEIIATAKQVTGFAHALGIDIGQRESAATEQPRDLVGIDAVVLGFAAVNGFHVKGVAENEGNGFGLLLAQIGK